MPVWIHSCDGKVLDQRTGRVRVTFGGAEGTRTPDFLLAKEALSRLSYSPVYRPYYSSKTAYSQSA